MARGYLPVGGVRGGVEKQLIVVDTGLKLTTPPILDPSIFIGVWARARHEGTRSKSEWEKFENAAVIRGDR